MSWQTEPEIDDGYYLHAPVGSFQPNGFGLYDMHGNVFEWCRDAGFNYDVKPRKGDGLRFDRSGGQGGRITRGGSFAWPSALARSAFRYFDLPDTKDGNLGVRAAREVTGTTR